MSDEFLAEAKERLRRLIDDMPARERSAWFAKIMASAAFAPHGDLSRELRSEVFATIDALAASGDRDPATLAIDAFLRHGYHAELEDRDEVAVLKVDRIQG